MAQARRTFVRNLALTGAGVALAPSLLSSCRMGNRPFFKISLAQWSLHRTFFGQINWMTFGMQLRTDPASVLQGERDPLDFPLMARQDFGIDGLEYVNTFYFDKARDENYLRELRNRCNGEGVESVLIMCDQEGALGDPDPETREQAVINHYKWVDAAAFLGCHAIRVNAQSRGEYDEQMKLAADGLYRLCEYADDYEINVIVENHGGLSSNAKWLSGVMELVNHARCGTLPDFGNFWIGPDEEYDRYLGMTELMPYAKGVSAKSNEFDGEGNEIHSDYYRILQIVKDAGYTGYIGIEYEGSSLSEYDGILATKELLIRAGRKVK